jgi:hypothetical protein
MCDWPDTRWQWLDDLPFTVMGWGDRAACAFLGHTAYAECSNPDHDRCAYCTASLPGKAPRGKVDA